MENSLLSVPSPIGPDERMQTPEAIRTAVAAGQYSDAKTVSSSVNSGMSFNLQSRLSMDDLGSVGFRRESLASSSLEDDWAIFGE